jgi:hypothetical protein
VIQQTELIGKAEHEKAFDDRGRFGALRDGSGHCED